MVLSRKVELMIKIEILNGIERTVIILPDRKKDERVIAFYDDQVYVRARNGEIWCTDIEYFNYPDGWGLVPWMGF